VLSRLDKGDLVIPLGHNRQSGLLLIFNLKFDLVCVLESALIRISEMDGQVTREFTIARVMDLERCLVNGDVRVGEAVVDLELNLLNEEGKILLVNWVVRIAIFPQSAHIAAPFMRERKVLAGGCCIPHFLRHRANDDRNVDFRAFDTHYFGHLLKRLIVSHWLVKLVSRLLDFIRLVVRPIRVVLHY
jgi:hypothetical protein